jgi:disulfide bond formation protein DsbB
MTDDAWIDFFVVLTIGANASTLALWGLALAARAGRGGELWERVRDSLGESGLAIAAIIALTATAGSLYLSEGADLLPCTLCWYQRIAMYSLALVLAVGTVRRDWAVRPYALALALAGPVVSVYHYLVERFPDLEVEGSCDAFNPCSLVPVWRLHFVSIPFMALSAFLLVDTVLAAARPAPAGGEEPLR